MANVKNKGRLLKEQTWQDSSHKTIGGFLNRNFSGQKELAQDI